MHSSNVFILGQILLRILFQPRSNCSKFEWFPALLLANSGESRNASQKFCFELWSEFLIQEGKNNSQVQLLLARSKFKWVLALLWPALVSLVTWAKSVYSESWVVAPNSERVKTWFQFAPQAISIWLAWASTRTYGGSFATIWCTVLPVFKKYHLGLPHALTVGHSQRHDARFFPSSRITPWHPTHSWEMNVTRSSG